MRTRGNDGSKVHLQTVIKGQTKVNPYGRVTVFIVLEMSAQEPGETFTERFVRLTTGMKASEIGSHLGIGEHAVRKLLNGDTQDLKLRPALRLARHLGVSPWYLACDREPVPKEAIEAQTDFRDVIRTLQADVAELMQRSQLGGTNPPTPQGSTLRSVRSAPEAPRRSKHD